MTASRRLAAASAAFATVAALAAAADHGWLADADRRAFEAGVHWPTDVASGWLFAEGWLSMTHPH